MANVSNDFGTVKNLRVWMNALLSKEVTINGKKAKFYLHRKNSSGEDICYNADLIWDGTNYHITYSNTEDIGDTTEFYVLPFTYTDAIVWSIKPVIIETSTSTSTGEGETV